MRLTIRRVLVGAVSLLSTVAAAQGSTPRVIPFKLSTSLPPATKHEFSFGLRNATFDAGSGQAQDTPPEGLDVRLMPGIGGMVFLSPLGAAFSAGLALQVSRFLLLGEVLGGGASGLLTLFAGGAAGLYIGDGRNVPYALAGLGIITVGNGDDRGHSAVVFSGEFGGAFFRSRERRGQIWLGARVFVPLATTLATGETVYGGVPSIPVLSINLRFWL